MKQIKAAKYTSNAISDYDTISTLESILDKQKVIPFLSKNDKTPNYDGYLEVLDDEKYSLGKLEVQVKTLKKGSSSPSYSVKLSLLAYAKESQLPFILIAVDQSNKKAYWKELNRKTSSNLIDKALSKSVSQKSIAVDFEITKEISSSEVYNEWKCIINNQKQILHQFDDLNKELIIAKSELDKIISQSSTLEVNPSFNQSHLFLDTLNDLFNREFKVVRTLFIADFWKFGIFILEISETNITYSLFTIGREENQKQIIVDSSGIKDIVTLSGKYNNIRAYSGSNPILSLPMQHAYERCWEYLKALLDRKILWPNNHYLEREYLFFIKDNYFKTTDEEPLTIDLIELKNQIENYLSKIPLAEKSIMIQFPESNFNLYRALDYIQTLRLMGIAKSSRLSPSRKSIQNISFSFAETGVVSKKLKATIYSFWSAFLESYENVIYQYFPDIANDIKYLNEYDKLIIVPYTKAFTNNKKIAVPYFMIYKLKKLNPHKSRKIIIETNPNALKLDFSMGGIIYKNKQYMNWERESVAISKFSDVMPLRNLIYIELFKNLETFFKQKYI